MYGVFLLLALGVTGSSFAMDESCGEHFTLTKFMELSPEKQSKFLSSKDKAEKLAADIFDDMLARQRVRDEVAQERTYYLQVMDFLSIIMGLWIGEEYDVHDPVNILCRPQGLSSKPRRELLAYVSWRRGAYFEGRDDTLAGKALGRLKQRIEILEQEQQEGTK